MGICVTMNCTMKWINLFNPIDRHENIRNIMYRNADTYVKSISANDNCKTNMKPKPTDLAAARLFQEITCLFSFFENTKSENLVFLNTTKHLNITNFR